MDVPASVKLMDGRTVRLGRIRPVALPQVLRFASYFDAALATPPPATVDYASKASASLRRMYQNDRYGCCVISGKMHQLGVWSANDTDSGGEVQATDQEVVQQYQTICGPGDRGCVITSVLDVMRSRGMQAGGKRYTIDGYVSIDNTNKLEVQVAIYLFGSLTLGINLPNAWANSPDGGTWDVTNTGIVGGHDVCTVGYNAQGVQISTWGGLRTITWAAFTSRRWIDETYAQLAPLWYNSDRIAPCGFNATKLLADLQKLGGGVMPDLDPPTPPPGPTPPPTPPPGPSPAIGDIKSVDLNFADGRSVTLPVVNATLTRNLVQAYKALGELDLPATEKE